MSTARDIALHLVSGTICSGIGIDVFLNYTPPAPIEAVIIYDTAGLQSTKAFGEHNVRSRRPGIQVQVRSASQSTAMTLAESIHAELDGWGGGTVSGTVYDYSEALQEPFFLKRDDSNNVYVAFNAIMTRR